jgi:mono/diheme cytochrome c family protein
MRSFLLGVVAGMLLVPIVIGTFVLQGFMSTTATAQPPVWEASLAQRSLLASLKRRTTQSTSPVVPSEENLLKGMKLYRNGCDGCHGQATQPSSWGTTSFYPRVPQFPQNPPHLTEAEMFSIIKHGIRYSGMGAWDGQYSDEEIWNVVTFLSHLDALPPRVAAAWREKS